MAWTSGRSCSSALRGRVLAAIDGGHPARAVARLFQVRVPYVHKALARREATDETEARPAAAQPADAQAGDPSRGDRGRDGASGRRAGRGAGPARPRRAAAAQRTDWRAQRSGMSPARPVFVDGIEAATNTGHGATAAARAAGAWTARSRTVPGTARPSSAAASPRRLHRPPRHRQGDERHHCPRLGRADAGTGAAPGRHRDHGQSAGPQGRRRRKGDQGSAGGAAPPAAPLARPVGSSAPHADRAGLRQAPGTLAQGGRADHRRPVVRPRQAARPVPTGRARQQSGQLPPSTVSINML